jgi:TM2 domain-containing membrane protein YozV/RNA polymerase subunit RPABC4/transcription elongation factor Spt4
LEGVKYCSNCGSQIDENAEICPECGAEQEHPKMKYCSNCGSQIDENAEICPECGVRQTVGGNQQQVYQHKNPGISAVLSFLFVGLGQIYNGEIAKGLIFLFCGIICIFLMLIFIGYIFYLILWVFGIYDAYNTANKINSGEITV